VAAAMNALVFSCPKTGREIDPGIDIAVRRRALENVQPVTIRLVCPQCNSAHVWKLADGWIREPQAMSQFGAWRAV
jgi:hypothetical protein